MIAFHPTMSVAIMTEWNDN